MNFAFVHKAVGLVKKGYTVVKPYLPYVAMGAGTVSVCAGAFLACKATLNVDRVLEEHRTNLELSNAKTAELLEKNPGCLTPKEIRSDKFQLYSVTAGKLFRMYGPSVGLIIGGFTCIFSAFGTVVRWHSMALNALSAVQAKFSTYRHNVIDNYGEDVDRQLAGEVVETKTLNVAVGEDENGETVYEAKEVYFDEVQSNDFIDVYDYRNSTWKYDSFVLIQDFFVTKVEWYTKLLQHRGFDYVWLNTMKDEFGFDESAVGHWYGWTSKCGCGIDVKITPCRRFVEYDSTVMQILGEEEHSGFDIAPDLTEDNALLIPYSVVQNDRGRWVFENEEDEQEFRELMAHDVRDVAWIFEWNVDTDEKGVPKEIYSDVFGTKLLKSAK